MEEFNLDSHTIKKPSGERSREPLLRLYLLRMRMEKAWRMHMAMSCHKNISYLASQIKLEKLLEQFSGRKEKRAPLTVALTRRSVGQPVSKQYPENLPVVDPRYETAVE